jgi:hypothetical protein
MSQRFAICTALLLVVTGCSAPAREGGLGPAPVVTSIQISPDSATLQVGDSIVLAVSALMSDGSVSSIPVGWVATGGTLGAGAVYHAGGTPGQYMIIATTAQPLHADTTRIIIRDTTVAPTLSSIVVTPAAVTLDPGASATFTAQGFWSDGSLHPVNVAWAGTGGSISSGGVYQAGSIPGSFRVVATTPPNLSDTAFVAVRDTTTPPSNGTVLFSEGFEDASVSARGWYDNTAPAISTVEHQSGAGALQMAFAVGGTKPAKGGALRHKFAPTDRVFLRYWVKYSSNWVGSGVAYHPHEFYFVTNLDGDWVGPSYTHLTTYVEHSYQNGGIPRLGMQDAVNIDTTKINVDLTGLTEQRAAAGCNGKPDGYTTNCYQSGGQWFNEKVWKAAQPAFTATPGPGYKNDWHKIEAYFQLNSIQNGKAVNDGIAQYWFDGQLLIDHQNVQFRTGANPTMKFDQFLIAPWIGVGSPVAQTMWVDDVVVATGRVP